MNYKNFKKCDCQSCHTFFGANKKNFWHTNRAKSCQIVAKSCQIVPNCGQIVPNLANLKKNELQL